MLADLLCAVTVENSEQDGLGALFLFVLDVQEDRVLYEMTCVKGSLLSSIVFLFLSLTSSRLWYSFTPFAFFTDGFFFISIIIQSIKRYLSERNVSFPHQAIIENWWRSSCSSAWSFVAIPQASLASCIHALVCPWTLSHCSISTLKRSYLFLALATRSSIS